MSYTFTLTNAWAKDRAKQIIASAPLGYVFKVAEGGRTAPQNAKMWAMLADIAQARPEGRKMAPEYWKAAFMSALGHEIVWQPGIDGAPPFPAGFRTSRLSKSGMADLITFIQAYGDKHGVQWSDEARAA